MGPGIFAIGYTIGTGSVTSMAKAGADYGLMNTLLAAAFAFSLAVAYVGAKTLAERLCP